VDGAGKSTVIENIRHQVEKRYRRKVVVLRHRPALLPMLSAWKEGREAAEERAAQRLPRQGNNQSTLSSLLRFAYYYTDYVVGQFIVQAKYVWRGYVVLYDRYYFDFINDGKRSNICLSPKLTSIGYRLLLKPKFNFFLYADVDTILQRKQELDGPSINALTGQYLGLFRRLSQRYNHSQYITIENLALEQTLHIIHQHLQPTIV
jgi:thymidylate kinase